MNVRLFRGLAAGLILASCAARAADSGNECAIVGQIAAQVVDWRDHGLPESTAVAEVMPHIDPGDTSRVIRGMIHDIYTAAAAAPYSSDAARTHYADKCTAGGS